MRIVVGGYDPSLAPEAWTDPALGVDVIVRGEGDMTFREMHPRARRTAAARRRRRHVVPRRRRRSAATRTAPSRARTTGEIRLPNRAARVLSRLHDDGTADRRRSKPRAAARSTAASARSSRCAGGTSTAFRSNAVIEDIRDAAAPRRAQPSSSSTTTSRWTCRGSRSCARRSSRPA